MRSRFQLKIGGGFILLLFLLACALPSAGVATPVQNSESLAPENLGTAIAQTAIVAQTRTAAALPPTLTPTQTREPTATLIGAPPTQTPFTLFSNVPVETLDPAYAVTQAASGLGPVDPLDEIPYTGRPWTCIVRSSNPRGGIIQPEIEFYAYWYVINTGTKPWTSTTVDFIYKSGFRHIGTRIQDLTSAVASGRGVTFKAFFIAPKRPGVYTATYVLKVGNRPFCGMKMFFEVPKKEK